jgi:tetratricopeptide (TPR) repeat protein
VRSRTEPGDPSERAFAVAGLLLDTRPEKALKVLEAARPDELKTWCYRAAAYLNLDRNEEAIRAAQAAIGIGGPIALMLDIICVASLRLGDAELALSAIEEARGLEPDDAGFAIHYAAALAATPQNRQRGLELADEAAAIAPTDAGVLQARLEIALAFSQEQAPDLARRLLAVEPENTVAHLALAGVHSRNANLAAARHHLHLGIRTDPHSSLIPEAAASTWAIAHPLAWYDRIQARYGGRRTRRVAVVGGCSVGVLAGLLSGTVAGALLIWLCTIAIGVGLASTLSISVLRKRKERQLRSRQESEL